MRETYSTHYRLRCPAFSDVYSPSRRNRAPLPALSSPSYSARTLVLYDAEYRRDRAFAGTPGSGTCSLVELTVGVDSSLALNATFQDQILLHLILTQRAVRRMVRWLAGSSRSDF